MKIVGLYSVQFFNLVTKVTETAKVYKYSLVDVMKDPTTARPGPTTIAQLTSDPQYLTGAKVSAYYDKYWAIDFLKVFGLDLAGMTSYYGANKQYFTLSFFNEGANTHANELLPAIWAYFFP